MPNRKDSNNPPRISRDYLDGLKDFWAGRYQTTLEHVTGILADTPNHSAMFPLYRLWLEILAESGDASGLRTLSFHLKSRSDVEPENRPEYFALRGLIHAELDEFEAVELMCRALGSPSVNGYAAELWNVYLNRKDEGSLATVWGEHLDEIHDYFHWRSAVISSFLEGRSSEWEKRLKAYQSIFVGSPLENQVKMHVGLESGDFANAATNGKELFQQYPLHPDYGLYYAFALIKKGDDATALEVLTKIVSVEGESDADVLALLGHCYKEAYLRNKDANARERSGYFLRKAETLLEEAGFSAVFVNHQFNEIRSNRFGSEEGESKGQPRAWMIQLNSRHYYELQTADQKDVKFISRAIGDQAQPGDLCFFVTDNYHQTPGTHTLRIGAIYVVTSEPRWHPISGVQSVMELVGRPAASIPVELDLAFENEEMKSLRRFHPLNFGAYELDAAAVEQVARSMEEFGAEIQGEQFTKQLARMRQIS